ncbi:hypothetical protein EAO27_13345 [Sphingopyxis sp. YF1]|nr:hypothetical protein EAO27_13345 [Sphingopyxis sp. YF1]
MSLAQMHREDVKAALRKKYGTIRKFEIAHGFSPGSVHDVLRHRKWARVERAIAAAIDVPSSLSEKTDSTAESSTQHLIAGAQ